MNHWDYIEAGFKVFGLYGADDNGKCECGNPECEAVFKHPRTTAWQYTPDWSDEQLDTMEKTGQFGTGFGVLVSDHLVIDIDPRNGGNEGYKQLCEHTGLDFKALSGFVVATGGGGWHIYFKRPQGLALHAHDKRFPGIDFKSSGYVVGAGSLHKSGNTYEAEKGHPEDVSEAPAELVELLKKPERMRSEYNGQALDLSEQDIADMLRHVDADCDYDQWIKTGMAVHDATGGTGVQLWDEWSASGEKYAGAEAISRHWYSFGKSANPVTIGTLLHYATEGGYVEPVTFHNDQPITPVVVPQESEVDILRPPGFVGDVTKWINSQCRYPREHLATAAALSAVGNIVGLRYADDAYSVTSNQFIFCVAGSATGKEAVQQAQSEIHTAAGLGPATHGAIKSEQEIIRNLVDHQAALYVIDELGITLQKIQNARKRGGAAYLEGVIGTLMSAYSKADNNMLLGGDVRKDVLKSLAGDIATLRKQEDHDGSDNKDRIADILKRMTAIEQKGLERPFLSLIGYTTPVTFNDLVDHEGATNGFFGRALIIQERDTNPRAKKGFKKPSLPSELQMSLAALANGGEFDVKQARVEHYGKKMTIPTSKDAAQLLEAIQDEFHDMSEEAKKIGLEAIPRRGFEQVLKTSFVLAAPEGLRTVEHVRWAFAYVKRDIDQKINLAAQNIADDEKRHDEALTRRIIGLLDYDQPEKLGIITNRCRKYKKQDVVQAIDLLVASGKVVERTSKGKNGKTTRTFLLGK